MWWGVERVLNPRREIAAICGGKPGPFFLAIDADRGETTNE